MRRVLSIVPVLVWFLQSTAAIAEESVAQRSQSPSKFPVREFLAPSKQRLGVAVALLEAGLLVRSAESDPRHLNQGQRFQVPGEARGVPPVFEKVRLSEQSSALWVRYEVSDEKFYSLVFLGAPADSEPEVLIQAQLVLKGWNRKGESTLQLEKSRFGQRLVLRTGQIQIGCGRNHPKKTLVLDHRTSRFRTARLPLLNRTERGGAAAALVQAAVLSKEDHLLRVMHRAGDQEPSDGDRERVWERPHAVTEFSLPRGANPNELLLQLNKKPAGGANRLYLAVEDDLFALHLEGSKSTLVSVTLPESESERQCFALIQPRQPVPLVEIMGRSREEHGSTLDELVRGLEAPNAEHSLAALGLRGSEGARLVAQRFLRFGPLGRRRALDLAASLRGGAGADVYVVALELGGDEERREARRALLELGEPGVRAISRRFVGASAAGESRLAGALATGAPARAARLIFRKLNQPSAARRSQLRKVVSELFSSEPGQSELVKILSEQARAKRMSRSSSSEVVRALRPVLASHARHAVPVIQRLAADASFREAYRLLPSVAALLDTSKEAREIYGKWILGVVGRKISATESAALSVRALEVLEDDTGLDRQRHYRPQIASLSQSENVRVRASALRLAALVADPGRYRDLHELLQDDPWPRVRIAAAEALGALAKLPKAELSWEKRTELGKDLADQLTDEDEANVRRAVARALSRVNTEEATDALRDALDEDEDYQVRAEAALSLGRVCDRASIERLTELTVGLVQGLAGDGPVSLALAAMTALVQLNPHDLQDRLKPLFSDGVPGPLRARIEDRLRRAEGSVCQK